MRPRLIMLIATGCLLAGSLQLWLQLPNRFSNYLTRWEAQDYREKTGVSAVSIPVDMESDLWPSVIGLGLFLIGVALLATGIGIRTRRYWGPVVGRLGVGKVGALALVPALAIVALWRPGVVQYHRIAMRSWHAQPSLFWERHQHALVALDYFQRREFALERRVLTNRSEFMRLADAARFRDDQWMVAPYSNRVSVTAYRGDMKTWEDVVRSFDHAEIAPPEPPRASASSASGSRTLDSLPVSGSGGVRPR